MVVASVRPLDQHPTQPAGKGKWETAKGETGNGKWETGNREPLTTKNAKKIREDRKGKNTLRTSRLFFAAFAVKSFCYFSSVSFCVARFAASLAGFSFLISS
jgi:hypothetical protein